MKTLTKLLKKISIPLVVIYIAFLSYNYNFFHVVNDKWFFTHGQPTKRLIVDGLLRGKDEYGRLSLGKYSRPNIENQAVLKKLYNDRNKSGKFERYKSQYALQLHLFHYLEIFGYKNINTFHGITALLMSSVVGIFFYLLSRYFSITSALIFSATLILSPWIVVFARNLYWVPATWFVPMIISMYYSRSNFASKSFKTVTNTPAEHVQPPPTPWPSGVQQSNYIFFQSIYFFHL